ncbi:MAG: polysaccharide deacetylase family protein [Solirubrobacteraceae bacterium]|nr:polysaccharide deacetylase family protein [Solirubrobacteraceae bacterium]
MSALHLTFDDGPHPELTPRILETLASSEATATFFVLGARVREHPQLVDQILEAGHRVELHGDEHLDHRHASAGALARDTGRAIRTLTDQGIRLGWWRLPWGRPGPSTEALVKRTALRVIGWDADTHDWRGDGWDQQPETVRDTARSGGVVLLHDGFGPGATRSDGANTVEIVERLLAGAASHGTPVRALPPVESLGTLEALPGAGDTGRAFRISPAPLPEPLECAA